MSILHNARKDKDKKLFSKNIIQTNLTFMTFCAVTLRQEETNQHQNAHVKHIQDSGFISQFKAGQMGDVWQAHLLPDCGIISTMRGSV